MNRVLVGGMLTLVSMGFEPEMMIEEIGIALRTGRCPRCNGEMKFDVSLDEWEGKCLKCGLNVGGFN
jgi:hypothetical protein